MSRKLVFALIALGLIIASLGLALAVQTSRRSETPDNTTRLDQLNIQTDNPQPAGKNIAP